MELKPGYKQTEAGVIPEDWEVKQIREIAKVKGGKRLPLGKSLADTVTPHPYIRVTDMHQGSVNLANIRYVPEDAYPPIKNYRISSDDIFISVAGSLGIVGKVPKELDGANLTENADKITEIQCDRDYLLCCLIGKRIQNSIIAQQTQGAQPKLALNRIEDFVIPLPPLPEQRAIAATLSDTDVLLNSLDRLLAKKRDIKQAVMQQLLTGRQRLPGFSWEWQVKRLGDVVEIRKGQLITETDAAGGNVPVIAGGKKPAYFHNKANRTGKTITISGSGANAGYVAFHDSPIFASDCSTISQAMGYSLEFIFYQLQLTQNAIYKAQTGGAQPHIHPTDLRPIEIGCPPRAEQFAIAAVLSDMDAEIDALQRRSDKTRAIKQGMMQELLTGRTRLV